MGNPTGFHLTPGQAHDLRGADALLPKRLNAIRALLADKAYEAEKRVRAVLEKAGVEAVIPPKTHRKEPHQYDEHVYRARALIENFFTKLKQFRAIATRYDTTAVAFLGAIHLAAITIWPN